jgi:hypothetical protein
MHPLLLPVVVLMVIAVAFGVWLLAFAEETPSSGQIRGVCVRHDGVANVSVLEPILNRAVVVCRDGYVGYVP